MMTLERLRELEPKLTDKSDDEVAAIRERIYAIARLALDSYQESKELNK